MNEKDIKKSIETFTKLQINSVNNTIMWILLAIIYSVGFVLIVYTMSCNLQAGISVTIIVLLMFLWTTRINRNNYE